MSLLVLSSTIPPKTERSEERDYLFCITGLPGSGKSETSKLLSDALTAQGMIVARYSTDWIREQLCPRPSVTSGPLNADFIQGDLMRAYNGLFMLVNELLKYGCGQLTIIADGTFRLEAQRARLREIASHHEKPFGLIKVNTDEEILIPRITERNIKGEGSGTASYYSAKMVYEEPTGEMYEIDNNGDLKNLAAQVQNFVTSLRRFEA